MNSLVIIGSPVGERARAYAESLRGRAYRTISWWSVLDGERLNLPTGALIRCDSPSDDPALDAELIRLGGGDPTGLEQGRLMPSHRWYAGFVELLRRLDLLLDAEPSVQRMQTTDSMLAMFDKAETHRRLADAGVPVPPPSLAAADGQHFIKARYGSSGAGLIALRRHGGRWRASSTMHLTAEGVFNSRRAVNYDSTRESGALASLLDAVGPCIVQQWLPKITLDGGPCDFRVVVIGGRAHQMLARVGSGPFTNLHLGARRGDVHALRRELGEAWDRITAAAERAASCLPEAHYCGVDVLLTPQREAYVLELNAFGDFHEGVLVDGLDTYRSELAAWEGR